MEQKSLNSRQLQAVETKNKIYQTSIRLMEKKGYSGTKIEDICEKAGVSIGSFYNYFNSKNDILIEIFHRADDFFKNEVEVKVSGINYKEKIVNYFGFYAQYNKLVGLETVKQLYGPDINMFITKGRYMQEVLNKLIIEGQNNGELSDSVLPDEMNEYLFIAARGVIYDWCVHDGTFDVIDATKKYMGRLIQIFDNK